MDFVIMKKVWVGED